MIRHTPKLAGCHSTALYPSVPTDHTHPLCFSESNPFSLATALPQEPTSPGLPPLPAGLVDGSPLRLHSADGHPGRALLRGARGCCSTRDTGTLSPRELTRRGPAVRGCLNQLHPKDEESSGSISFLIFKSQLFKPQMGKCSRRASRWPQTGYFSKASRHGKAETKALHPVTEGFPP